MFVYIAVAPYVKTPVIQLNNPFIHDPGGPQKRFGTTSGDTTHPRTVYIWYTLSKLA